MISLLALLTACSGTQGLEGRFSPNPELQKNSETAQVTNNKLPENFPNEIPQYPQSTLQEIDEEITPKEGLTRWNSPDSSDKIKAFYQQELSSKEWDIIQPFSTESSPQPLIAQKDDLKIRISLVNSASTTEFTLEYKKIAQNQAEENSLDKPSPNLTQTNTFSDLDQVSQALRPYIQDLEKLNILTAKIPENNQFKPNEIITRREYARWLVNAQNKFYQNSPEKQIRLGLKNSQPAFSDVPTNDPDFAIIQGLAETGLIPSRLTGDSQASLFRPDAPLTRSNLIIWKVPLDTGKSLPQASIDGVKETWGFQDTAKIDPQGLRALYADFQNGEQGNVRRVFGYTTLFQPKKPVTRAQAAVALWYFGYQGEGLSAKNVLEQN
ncbi:MAG TPA: hypothetical protein DCF68_18140 [Cyanothece sp. UBA12306]|nr:hypothetical protein [Cyanothece sp. UBA12306]